MTNPYQEPEKGCVLCKVEVDFKNIQVNIYIMTWQLQAAQPMCLVSVTLGSFSFFFCVCYSYCPSSSHLTQAESTVDTSQVIIADFFFVPKHVVSVQMLTVDCCFFPRTLWKKTKRDFQSHKESSKIG